MENYILLADPGSGALTPDRVLRAADRIGKELDYRGSFVCFPSPGPSGLILATTPEVGMGRRDTERLFRHVAFDLSSPAVGLDGVALYADTDDNDVSFLDHIPAPEEEVGSIWLRFRIDAINASEPILRMRRLFDLRELDIEPESDGLSVYLSHNGVLDVFYDPSCDVIEGEIDTTYAGAGVYKEACDIAFELNKALQGQLEFLKGERSTYQYDHEFDKLRALYYESLRQQLIYAVADDRDGLQAYIGWGIDTYEPAEKAGSIVTFLGRYNIERLIEEIETYGFEAVADARFFIRNGPNRGAGEYVKTALSLFWTATTFRRGLFSDDEKSPGAIAANNIDEALRLDPYISIPLEDYLTECAILQRSSIHGGTVPRIPVSTDKCAVYMPHYEIGYLRERISYGFGSYLRKFKLDGWIGYTEIEQGRHVFFNNFTNPSISLECRIDYSEADALPDDAFFIGFDTIRQHDIGGTAFCRYAELRDDQPKAGGPHGFRARAEMLIRDERYTFVFSTDTQERLDEFSETVSGCRAVEDIDDAAEEGGEKPRAWGGCFYLHDASSERIPCADALNRLLPLLGDYAENSARIAFGSLEAEAESAVLSKFGGVPYQPAGFDIPTVGENDFTRKNHTAGKPLSFIAQVNFAQVEVPADFPERGILQLYAYLPERGLPKAIAMPQQIYFRVVYFENPEASMQTTGTMPALPELGMRFTTEAMMLTSCDYRFEDAVYGPLSHMTGELSQDEFSDLYDKFYQDGSRLGGYPAFAGDDRRSPDFEELDTLLLQLDSEDLAGIRIEPGEGPWLLNLFISHEALLRRDFSKILMMFTKDGDMA